MMNRSPQSGEWRMALALKFPPRVGNVRQRLVCDAFVSPNLVGTAVPLIGAGVSPSLAVAAVPLAEHTGLAGSKPAPVRCEFKYTWVVGTEHQRRHRREVERCAGGVAVGLQAEVARSGDLASQLLLWPLKMMAEYDEPNGRNAHRAECRSCVDGAAKRRELAYARSSNAAVPRVVVPSSGSLGRLVSLPSTRKLSTKVALCKTERVPMGCCMSLGTV